MCSVAFWCCFVHLFFFYHLLINKVAHWHWLRSSLPLVTVNSGSWPWVLDLRTWPLENQGVKGYQCSKYLGSGTVLTQFSCNVLLHFRLSCMLMMLFLFLYILKRHFVYCPLYFDRRTMSWETNYRPSLDFYAYTLQWIVNSRVLNYKHAVNGPWSQSVDGRLFLFITSRHIT